MEDPIPLSSIYFGTTNKIPLSLGFVDGTAIVINFIGCSSNCSSCPWDANLDMRSARIVKWCGNEFVSVFDMYKPDMVFLNGGDFWRYKGLDKVLAVVTSLDTVKGSKIIPLNAPNDVLSNMFRVIEISDIVLVEVNRLVDMKLFENILRNFAVNKHFEIVLVEEDPASIESLADTTIEIVTGLGLLIPLNIVSDILDTALIHKSMSRLREKYPLIHTLWTDLTEYSSVICPYCKMPVVARSGAQIVKMAIDNECRCKYCGNKIISSSRGYCRSRKPVKATIIVPLT